MERVVAKNGHDARYGRVHAFKTNGTSRQLHQFRVVLVCIGIGVGKGKWRRRSGRCLEFNRLYLDNLTYFRLNSYKIVV